MRLLVPLAVLALAVALFLLLRPAGAPPAPEGESLEPGAATTAPRPVAPGPTPDRGLPVATRRVPRNVAREPATGAYDTGSIALRLVPDPGVSVSPGLRIALEAVGPEIPGGPVFVARADGLYAATGVPAGKHRLRVFSEGALEAVVEAEVTKDTETLLEVPLSAGAAASYDVTLASGERPEQVTFELIDARGHAIPAVYQTPLTTLRIVPEKPVVVPPTGKVLGLRPGKYVLKAKSAAGETAEQAFTAKAGETTPLEFKIRR